MSRLSQQIHKHTRHIDTTVFRARAALQMYTPNSTSTSMDGCLGPDSALNVYIRAYIYLLLDILNLSQTINSIDKLRACRMRCVPQTYEVYKYIQYGRTSSPLPPQFTCAHAKRLFRLCSQQHKRAVKGLWAPLLSTPATLAKCR